MSLKNIAKATKNDYAFMANDENNPYQVDGWVDTGCYVLNAVLSDGDIFKGLPLGKRVAIGGKSSTAKSLFCNYIMGQYLKNVPNSNIILFETEGSSAMEMMDNFGVDKSRVLVIPVSVAEEWKTQFTNALEEIEKEQKAWKAKKTDEPMPSYMIAIDSLGMLASNKEYEDAKSGKIVQDMTRAKVLKSIYRIVTLKLSMLNVPHLVVNHTYDTQEMYSQEVLGGGTGLQYAADITLILTKAKMKEGTEQTGAVISFNVKKSRYMQENKKVKVLLHFRKGVYRWSDLLEKGIDLGVIERKGISYEFPDGQSGKRTTIMKKPEQFWNEENLKIVGEAIKRDFGFIDTTIDADFDDMEGDEDGDIADET